MRFGEEMVERIKALHLTFGQGAAVGFRTRLSRTDEANVFLQLTPGQYARFQ